MIIIRWFCDSTFGKACEDKLRELLDPYRVKSTQLNDPDFFHEIDPIWSSDLSKDVRAALNPSSKNDAEIAAHRDKLLGVTESLKGFAFGIEVHVSDDWSELVYLKDEDGEYQIRNKIVR